MEISQTAASRRFMNVFILAMMNLAIMASIRNLPIVAEYGLGSIFLYFIVGIAFLIPSALVSAELATGWTRTGGIYVWVREAFGPRWGFFAIWMQWVHNVSWYPAILSFVGATLGFLFNPALAQNKSYLLAVILILFWGMTFVNFFGLKTSSWFSTACVILGTLLPGFFIIIIGVHWYLSGRPIEIPIRFDALLPKFNSVNDFVFLAGMFLAFGGLEVNAVHAREVKDPQKNYPKAILIAALLAFILLALGSLSIAIVIPQEKISLVSGVMDAVFLILKSYHMEWLLTLFAILIILGAVGETNAWIIGPVRGLHATSKHGDLPPILQKANKRGIPYNLLIFQGIIVTFASLVFIFMPNASSAFWILSVLTAQLYIIMYIFMFLAALRLRYSHPEVVRSYRIPHKHKGMWFVAILGTFSSLGVFILGFFPPTQLEVGSLLFYESFLIIGLLLMVLIPLLIYQFKSSHWVPHEQLESKNNR